MALMDDKAILALLESVRGPMDQAANRVHKLRAALVVIAGLTIDQATQGQHRERALCALHQDAMDCVAETSPKLMAKEEPS